MQKIIYIPLDERPCNELLVLLHQTGKFFICQFPHLLSL